MTKVKQSSKLPGSSQSQSILAVNESGATVLERRSNFMAIKPMISDLNEATETGIYPVSNPQNAPLKQNGCVMVFGFSVAYFLQMYYPNANAEIYTRRYLNGNWTAWVKVTTTVVT